MNMIYHILAGTPFWVWAILLLLLVLGFVQTRDRQVGLPRMLALPLAMTSLSLYGTFSVFGATAWNWALWGGAALGTAAWFASGAVPAGVRYDAARRVFSLPGSWQPFGLMMAVFAVRYGVGIALALHPALVHDTAVAAMVASLYGVLSGIFLGRIANLLRSMRPAPQPEPRDSTTVVWG